MFDVVNMNPYSASPPSTPCQNDKATATATAGPRVQSKSLADETSRERVLHKVPRPWLMGL